MAVRPPLGRRSGPPRRSRGPQTRRRSRSRCSASLYLPQEPSLSTSSGTLRPSECPGALALGSPYGGDASSSATMGPGHHPKSVDRRRPAVAPGLAVTRSRRAERRAGGEAVMHFASPPRHMPPAAASPDRRKEPARLPYRRRWRGAHNELSRSSIWRRRNSSARRSASAMFLMCLARSAVDPARSAPARSSRTSIVVMTYGLIRRSRPGPRARRPRPSQPVGSGSGSSVPAERGARRQGSARARPTSLRCGGSRTSTRRAEHPHHWIAPTT